MSSRKLIVRGIGLTYLHYSCHFLSIFLLTPIMLDFLGKEAYGLWAIFGSIVGYLGFFNLGLNTAVAKYTAQYAALEEVGALSRLVSTTLCSFTVLGIAIILGSLGLMPFLSRVFDIQAELAVPAKACFFIMAVNSVTIIVGAVFGNVLYGYQRVDLWKMGGIAQLISTMATTLLFLHLGFGLVGIAIASFLGTGIMLFLYLFFLYHDPKYELSIRYGLASMRTLREILPYSLRSFVLGITSQVLYFTDNILIGLFLGASDVTSFFIAFRVTFLVTYIFSVISTTLFPRFSNLYALRKIEELRELFLRTTKISVAIMTSLAICLFLYGQPFITLWVGNENFIGMSVLSALIIMDFFHAFGTTPGLLLQGIGKNRIFVYSEVTNSVLKLLLSVVLVREQGVLGVVVGTLLGHILTSCWAVPWLACRYTSLSILRYLKAGILPPLIAGVPVLCLALLLRDYLLPPDSYIRIGLDSFFLILAYGGSYLALGLAKEERKTYFNFVLRRYSALVQR